MASKLLRDLRRTYLQLRQFDQELDSSSVQTRGLAGAVDIARTNESN
jgi:hypothetical protein